MDTQKFYKNKVNRVLLAIICMMLWGSAFPAIKSGYKFFNIAGDDIASKFIFAGYRFSFAGFLVLAYLIVSKKNIFKLKKKEYGQIVRLGILNTTIQYIFFYVGLSYTTGVRGAVINGTGTFMTIILAHFVYKNDKLTFNKTLGCIIGFAGVIIVNLNGSSFFSGSFKITGEGFMFIAAFCSAVASIYSKDLASKISPSIVTGYQLLTGGILLSLLGHVLGGNLSGFTMKSTILIIYMSLLSAVAFVIWTHLLKFNRVGEISVFKFLTPVFGTVFSGIFLKENIFDPKIIMALILVCTGIYLVSKVKKEKVR